MEPQSLEQQIIRYLASKTDDLQIAVLAGYLEFNDGKYTVTEKGYSISNVASRFTPKPKTALEAIFK